MFSLFVGLLLSKPSTADAARVAEIADSPLSDYNCYLCSASVEQARITKESSLLASCNSLFNSAGGMEYCNSLPIAAAKLNPLKFDLESDPRTVCEEIDVCSSLRTEGWRNSKRSSTADESTSLDIRVAKAYGTKGYDKVRLSAISSSGPVESEYFTYSEQFKYRWTNFYLNTGVVRVTPGVTTDFTIAGQTVSVYIPVENDGIRGAVFADPCFTNEFVWCTYGEKFNMLNRSTELLNAINSHEDSNFWMILGDNFYDQSGEPTAQWFSKLTPQTKAKVYASVPGNHDFWILSSPVVWMKRKDQLANGFMQFNGQDVAASVAPEQAVTLAPFDFSVDPDAEDATAHSLPPAGNFFSYYKLGNTGFMSYSGGHSYNESAPYFEEACNFMTESAAAAVVLLGHWNLPGLGCTADMDVPHTYKEILSTIPACAELSGKMRYMMGHVHCNVVVEQDVGYMVAGQGMATSLPCAGHYGMPIIDTHNGTFSVYYFDIQNVEGEVEQQYDNYDAILDCITQNGVSGCYHLATEWSSTPLV